MADTSISVLIVRLDAIGDALALTPLVAALHSRGARVSIVLRPENADIFAREAFEHVETARFALRDTSKKNVAAIVESGHQLKDRHYDAVLVATEDPGGYRLARAIGAPHRIGFDNGWGKPLKTLWIRRMCTKTIYRTAGLDPRAPHECEVLLELARPLFGKIAAPRSATELRRFILDHAPSADPRPVVQITNKWERLGVELADVIELSQLLQTHHSVRFVSAQHEAAYAKRFADESGCEVVLFSDLNSWKYAISSAPCIVAPDSGAVQLAGMIGTACVALYPIENFTIQSARWRPWASPYRALSLEPGWPENAAHALESLLIPV